MSDYTYDAKLYYKENSQYFAFAFVDMFGGKIHMMLNESRTEIVHTFVEFLPNCFIDSKGVFNNLSNRSEFKFDYIVSMNMMEAQEFLKKLKVKYTDVTLKKNVREYLRNNMLVFTVFHNNTNYSIGLYAIGDMFGKPRVMFVSYDGSHGFGSYISHFDVNYFANNIIDCKGFKPNLRWYYKH